MITYAMTKQGMKLRLGHKIRSVAPLNCCSCLKREFMHTENPVLSSHLKIDITKVLKTNSNLMEVESIAECSFGAFGSTFDLH